MESAETKTPEEGKDMTLEETFSRLEEIIGKLENPGTSLEDSFALYREGCTLLKAAQGKVDLIDRQVRQLNDDGSITDFQ